MRRHLLLALTLLSLASAANAEGRWGARVEWPLQGNAFIEGIAYSAGPWELGTGLMGRFEQGEPLEMTPYVVLSNFREEHWFSIEAALPVSIPVSRIGFSIALSFGGRFGSASPPE